MKMPPGPAPCDRSYAARKQDMQRRRANRGQALTAGIFWIVGIVVFFSPFLRPQQSADPEGDDPGRKVSEIDIPFAEDVGYFEEDFELELGDAIEAASEEWFGIGSDKLRESGLFELARLEPGKHTYAQHCQGCHGSTGDGAGPAARHLKPRPRNFRKGLFKFTSTPSGVPPQRRDLFQTVTRGLAGSSMPEFRLLSEERRWDVVEYVRYITIRGLFEQTMLDWAWEEEELPDPEEVAEVVLGRWSADNVKPVYPPIAEIARTPETVARGMELFQSTSGANCAACHGQYGAGDGPTAGDYDDDWGYPLRPRNLAKGVFRAGAEPADLYRSIATGINGTPMPSYSGSIAPEDIWSLVHFIQSLSEQ